MPEHENAVNIGLKKGWGQCADQLAAQAKTI